MKKQCLGFLLSCCAAFLFGLQQQCYGYAPTDSLLQKTYIDLAHDFNTFKYDFARAESYAKAYLKKSIIDQDSIKKINAYYFLSLIYSNAFISEQYTDSIIALKKAIDNYNTHKENNNYESCYGTALYALGGAYLKKENYDSAAVINKKGLEISLKNKDHINTINFTITAGIIAYSEKRYANGLEHLQKATKMLEITDDIENLRTCYLYIGKIYKDQREINGAVLYFKKVDALMEQNLGHPSLRTEIRAAYKFLVDYYQRKEDRDNELKYVKRLTAINELEIRSYAGNGIAISLKNKDPGLIQSEKRLIIGIVSLVLMLLFMSIITYRYYKKQRIYKIILLNENNEDVQKKRAVRKPEKNTTKALNISDRALHKIKAHLKVFVEEKQFLNNDVSLSNLAKTWNTNPKFLSQVIKVYEGKNFRDYIRDLRIDYAVKALSSNTQLRRYSVKAIAKEMGFNTAESFSKAFHKKTGYYPSGFIKKQESESFDV